MAATKTNAEAFRKEADLGTLTPGKFADILVIEGDPLQDIGILYDQETINVVFKEGEVASTDEEHKHLYRVRLDQPLRCRGVKD